jgi:hypothetical protein
MAGALRDRALAGLDRRDELGLPDDAGGGGERGELHLHGEAATLISEHSQAAHILAIVFTAFTAVLILTFAAYRISGGGPTGLGIVDRLLGTKSTFNALRILLVVLAIGAGFMTFRTGDLGAISRYRDIYINSNYPAATKRPRGASYTASSNIFPMGPGRKSRTAIRRGTRRSCSPREPR